MRALWLAVLAGAALVSPAAAERADDDLAAVKKAVGGATVVAEARDQPAARAATPAPQRAARVEEDSPARSASRPRGGEARWLRVRIVEKGGKHGRVSVNLPLVVVRAFGDEWPIHGCRRCGNGRGPTIGEVLRALDSGESLVEIDDEDATVRVWVD